MQSFLYKIFSLKQGELKLLVYSTLFMFAIFASYAILRPIRDALGLEGHQEELKWLFLGTFIVTIFCSILAMVLSGMVKRVKYINFIFLFFTFNLVLFYFALLSIDEKSSGFVWLSRIFYIWVSVFNLFIISSAWSLLADIFNKDKSKRLFGFISAGASLGSIIGAFGISFLISFLGNANFILISILLLLFTIFIKKLLIKQSYILLEDENKNQFLEYFDKPIGSKNPFVGFRLILHSKYLVALLFFIMLLTSVSTFLYMEQARIIREFFPTREARAAAFANIDLIVQSASFIIQIFFTSKIAQIFGLKILLSFLGFLVAIGFICLAFVHPAFLPLVVVMSIRRVGEYALVKPGREMLFVPLDSETKYKVKNFFDTVVYRGGDAISAQLEGALAKISISLTLFVGAILAIIWGVLGLYLGEKYNKNKNKTFK